MTTKPFIVATDDAARHRALRSIPGMVASDWPSSGTWHMVHAVSPPTGFVHVMSVPDDVVAYWRGVFQCGKSIVMRNINAWAATFPAEDEEETQEAAAGCEPLTSEEEARVATALNADDTTLVSNLAGCRITGADVRRVIFPDWLNDEIINSYMYVLLKRCEEREDHVPCHAFNTFFYDLLSKKGQGYEYNHVKRWSSKVNVFALDKILLPVHLGNHWALAVVNIPRQRFEYYESFGEGDILGVLPRLRRWIQDEHQDKRQTSLDVSEWTDYIPMRGEIPHQTNGYDCGAFIVQYATHVVKRAHHDGAFPFTQRDMPCLRKRMLLAILDTYARETLLGRGGDGDNDGDLEIVPQVKTNEKKKKKKQRHVLESDDDDDDADDDGEEEAQQPSPQWLHSGRRQLEAGKKVFYTFCNDTLKAAPLSLHAITERRKRIHDYLRDEVFKGQVNFARLTGREIGKAFYAYDREFFKRVFESNKDRVQVKFKANSRMTSTVSQCRFTPKKGVKLASCCDVVLSISSGIVKNLFSDTVQVCVLGNRGPGASKEDKEFLCSRLEALQDVLEHEMVHIVVRYLCEPIKQDVHGPVFKTLAKNLFGHVRFQHNYMLPGAAEERATEASDIHIGDRVRILVPDTAGGKRGQKVYREVEDEYVVVQTLPKNVDVLRTCGLEQTVIRRPPSNVRVVQSNAARSATFKKGDRVSVCHTIRRGKEAVPGKRGYVHQYIRGKKNVGTISKKGDEKATVVLDGSQGTVQEAYGFLDKV